MKKAIGPLLCLALCLALAACGGEAQSTASSAHAALPGGGTAAALCWGPHKSPLKRALG